MRHTLWVVVFLWTVMCSAVGVARAQSGPVDFERDILPIFTRFGCNAGSCHGKQAGQNGFKLSLLGFEPLFDYDAIVKQLRGRRVFPADPDRSLILQKASGQLPHGGGKRLNPKSQEYQLDCGGYAIRSPERRTGKLYQHMANPPTHDRKKRPTTCRHCKIQ